MTVAGIERMQGWEAWTYGRRDLCAGWTRDSDAGTGKAVVITERLRACVKDNCRGASRSASSVGDW
jgi:hypothetical protein